jgi:hypothetical protein
VAAGLAVAGCGAALAVSPHPTAVGATYCGWDGAGVCPSLGDASAAAPVRTVGPDREVSLAGDFNVDAVAVAGRRIPGGGLAGAAFPERLFPSSGTLTLTLAGDQAVSFLIPPHAPGQPSAVSLGRPITVPVPPGVYGAVWLLEAGVGGNVGPLTMGLRAAGRVFATVPVTFGDWCNGGFPLLDAPPEYVGISLPAVLSTPALMAASASAAGPPADAARVPPRLFRLRCGLWAEEVPLPPLQGHALDALTLPAQAGEADPLAYVMALTLEVGPAPPIPMNS